MSDELLNNIDNERTGSDDYIELEAQELIEDMFEDYLDTTDQPQTTREFVAEVLGEIDEQLATAKEDKIIDDIIDGSKPLEYSMWTDGITPESLRGDWDDGRRMTALDIKTASDVLEDLSRSVEQLPNTEDRNKIYGMLKQGKHFLKETEYQFNKLMDARDTIMAERVVCQQTHDDLVGLGFGMESYLPARSFYSAAPSGINLTRSIEAIDNRLLAAGAIGGIVGLGIIYKLFKWLYNKIFGKTSGATDKTYSTNEKTKEVSDSNSSRDNQKVDTDDFKDDSFTKGLSEEDLAKILTGTATIGTLRRNAVSVRVNNVAGTSYANILANEQKAREVAKQIEDIIVLMKNHLIPETGKRLNKVIELVNAATPPANSSPLPPPSSLSTIGGMIKSLVPGNNVPPKIKTDVILKSTTVINDALTKLSDKDMEQKTKAILDNTAKLIDKIKREQGTYTKEKAVLINEHVKILQTYSKAITDTNVKLIDILRKNTSSASNTLHVEMAVSEVLNKHTGKTTKDFTNK